jgi:hypothetical protein
MAKSGTHPSQLHTQDWNVRQPIKYTRWSYTAQCCKIRSKCDNTYFLAHFQIDENGLRKINYGNHCNLDTFLILNLLQIHNYWCIVNRTAEVACVFLSILLHFNISIKVWNKSYKSCWLDLCYSQYVVWWVTFDKGQFKCNVMLRFLAMDWCDIPLLVYNSTFQLLYCAIEAHRPHSFLCTLLCTLLWPWMRHHGSRHIATHRPLSHLLHERKAPVSAFFNSCGLHFYPELQNGWITAEEKEEEIER